MIKFAAFVDWEDSLDPPFQILNTFLKFSFVMNIIKELAHQFQSKDTKDGSNPKNSGSYSSSHFETTVSFWSFKICTVEQCIVLQWISVLENSFEATVNWDIATSVKFQNKDYVQEHFQLFIKPFSLQPSWKRQSN